jgi:hypothetical protein
MTTHTIDNSFGDQLNQFKVPVILVDQSGRKIGKFFPEPVSWRESYKDDGCPHTLEELEAAHGDMINDPTAGRPLAEIWKSLGRT